jgi:multisubunit Na+/H+ antiporter MnhG subunit
MDRFECAVRLILILTFLIAAPLLAPAVGHQTEASGLRQVHQEASWRQVNAVLLRSSPPQRYGYGSMATFWVAARWPAPSGATRRGVVPTRSGFRAGTKVSIWIDYAGRLTGRRPLTVGMVKVRTVLVEFLTVIGVALALLALGGLVRLLLNRRRMAYWGIEWACFGPRWSTRRWPRS